MTFLPRIDNDEGAELTLPIGDPAAVRPPCLGDAVVRCALISDCGLYRYRLTRTWAAGPAAVMVMLNPSTADGTHDDPTIRRCLAFAHAWGCGSLTVVNLYAWRATRPADLWLAADPVGPDNDEHLRLAASTARETNAPLVGAWGASAPAARIAEVVALPGMERLTALAVTKAGQPKHPLYLPAGLMPMPWTPPNGSSAGPATA